MMPSRSAAMATTLGTAPAATASASTSSMTRVRVDVLMAPERTVPGRATGALPAERRTLPSIVSAMLSFACGHCGQLVFFENTVCLNCSTGLGFVPERLELVALEGPLAQELHRCANATLAGCNWMVSEPGRLCRSCELTRTRPNDADAVGLVAFASAEAAKRRAIM